MGLCCYFAMFSRPQERNYAAVRPSHPRPSNQMQPISLSTFFVGLEYIPPRVPSVAIISIFDFDIVGLSGVIDWLRLWRRSEIIGQIIFKSPFISRSKRGDGKKCQMKLAHNTNNFFQFV